MANIRIVCLHAAIAFVLSLGGMAIAQPPFGVAAPVRLLLLYGFIAALSAAMMGFQSHSIQRGARISGWVGLFFLGFVMLPVAAAVATSPGSLSSGAAAELVGALGTPAFYCLIVLAVFNAAALAAKRRDYGRLAWGVAALPSLLLALFWIFVMTNAKAVVAETHSVESLGTVATLEGDESGVVAIDVPASNNGLPDDGPTFTPDPSWQPYEDSHPNGQIKTRRYFKSDALGEAVPVGPYVSWFDNGQKESESAYQNGTGVGVATTWFRNGQKESEGELVNGEVHGMATTWYENGNIKTQSVYENGKSNGPHTSWYADGQMEARGAFKNDEPDGHTVSWYPTGQKEAEFTYKNAKPEGVATRWYENGKTESVDNFLNGERHGTFATWYENGQMKNQGSRKDGEFDGPNTDWYQSGEKSAVVNFVNGKLEGRATRWYENGQKQSEGNHRSGEMSGRFTYWYPSGRKQAEVTYVRGKQTAKQCWLSDGQERICE